MKYIRVCASGLQSSDKFKLGHKYCLRREGVVSKYLDSLLVSGRSFMRKPSINKTEQIHIINAFPPRG